MWGFPVAHPQNLSFSTKKASTDYNSKLLALAVGITMEEVMPYACGKA